MTVLRIVLGGRAFAYARSRLVGGLSALLLACIAPQAAPLEQTVGFTETFDGSGPYMDGLLEAGESGAWQYAGADGAFVFKNENDSMAVRYVSIARAPNLLGGDAKTDGRTVAALIRTEDAELGGAGVLVGIPDLGVYKLLVIGSGQRWNVLAKAGDRLRIVESGVSDAIVDDALNLAEVEQRGDRLLFRVNGTPIIDVPADGMTPAPVGIGVFGRGRFSFDAVHVHASAETLNAYRAEGLICDLPDAEAADETVLINAYRGGRMSSVALGGPDSVTGAVDIAIEPGETPLYVIAHASKPMIWRVTGDTERVRMFAGIGPGMEGNTLSGVTGIAADRTIFQPGENCDLGQFAYQGDSDRPRMIASASLGAEIDYRIDDFNPSVVLVPSGTIPKDDAMGIEPDWSIETVRRALFFNAGGVAAIDEQTLVTPADAAPYQLLPHWWGLVQLVAEGKLAQIGVSTFRVLTLLDRYPPGFDHEHAVTFIFPADIDILVGGHGYSTLLQDRICWNKRESAAGWCSPLGHKASRSGG